MDQYPNMVIIHVIHITPKQIDIIAPLIIINLPDKSIFLPKCEILGFLNQRDTEICEMTSLAFEPLAVEVASEQLETPLPYMESQFICSPTDISVH